MITCSLRYVIDPYKPAEFEIYRTERARDEECQAAYQYAGDRRCIVSYERSFMRPIFASDVSGPESSD
jgi:hypothetical protein